MQTDSSLFCASRGCACICVFMYKSEAGQHTSLVADLRGQVSLHPSAGTHTNVAPVPVSCIRVNQTDSCLVTEKSTLAACVAARHDRLWETPVTGCVFPVRDRPGMQAKPTDRD